MDDVNLSEPSGVGSSQPSLATLETDNPIPTVRTPSRIAGVTGFELVIGLRRPQRTSGSHPS